jgi:hypothetical protein
MQRGRDAARRVILSAKETYKIKQRPGKEAGKPKKVHGWITK